MGIADLFRPKWKHSNAAVRAAALRDLDDNDEVDKIAEMARGDSNESIRRAAVQKLKDAALLAEIASADGSADIRTLAEERASHLWMLRATTDDDDEAISHITDPKALVHVVTRAKDPQMRAAALARLDDDRALADVVRNTKHAAMRVEAVKKIDDTSILQGLALDADRKEVGHAAVDQIEDRDALGAISGKAKNKSVRARAKKKLAELAPKSTSGPSEEQLHHAEQVQLLRTVETIVKESGWKQDVEIAEARRAWEALGSDNDKLAARFDKAIEKFDKQRERYLERVAAAEERAAKGVVLEPPPLPEPEAEAEPEPEAAAEAAAPPLPGPSPEGEGDAEPAPESEAKTEKPIRPRKTSEELEAEAQDNLARLEEICVELEQLATSDSYREAEDALKFAAGVFAKPGRLQSPEVRQQLIERHELARTKLYSRVRELREADEWRRWANVPKQEALVKRAEQLLATADDEKDLPAALKALQAEWKKVGAGSRGKSDDLWKQFKATCDEIYEKSKAQRDARKQELTDNLDRKTDLCERVEAIQDSTDWDDTAAEIKRLQTEWKELGPVARRHSKKVWTRFRAACDHFFEARTPHMESVQEELIANLEHKQQMAEKVEGLLETITDDASWQAATDQCKTLQRQWRDIGHVPRKDSDKVYRRFKSACDAVFARRDEMREVERKAREAERLDQLEQLVALVSGTDASPEQLVEAWSKVRGLDDPSLNQRIYEACAAALEKDAESFKGTELDITASLRKKEKLCKKVEGFAPEDEKPDQPLAEKLKQAMASRALGVDMGAEKDPVEQTTSAQANYKRIGPTPGTQGADLDERFEKACAALGVAMPEPEPEPEPAPEAAAEPAPEAAAEPAPEAAAEPAPKEAASPPPDDSVDDGWD